MLAEPQAATTTTAPRVHAHRARGPEGFLVNSYLIETAEGVVVVDTQYLLTDAQGLKVKLDALDKPLRAIIVTHPHPDHYNGNSVVLAGRTVPIYATLATRDHIVAADPGIRAYAASSHSGDWPAQTILPTHVVDGRLEFTVDDTHLSVEDVGPGEAAGHAVVHLPQIKTLIVGDLVTVGMHPFVGEGRSAAWIRQLGYVANAYPNVEQVLPGHGPPATLDCFDDQIAYLTDLRRKVRIEVGRSSDLSTAVSRVGRTMVEAHPGYDMPPLADVSVQGVWHELQGLKPPPVFTTDPE